MKIQDKVIVSTVNENVVINGAGLETSPLMPWNMEEADERIFVYVNHASKELTAMNKRVDSNAVVIGITNFHQLVPLNELWIKFGAGKLLRFIPIYI